MKKGGLIYFVGIYTVIILICFLAAPCYGSEETPLKSSSYDNSDSNGSGGWIRYRLADPLRLEISYAGLEKEERRPRENYRGESFIDGTNYQLEARSWIEFGRHLLFVIDPKFIGSDNNNYKNDIVLKAAYFRFTVSNIELEAGRDSIWWGPGYHGALLASNNAFPFDMIRLGSAEPFQLPSVFKALGYFKISSFITRLEEERDFSGTKLFGLRIDFSPFSFLDLGLSRVTMFDGAGRQGLSFSDFLRLYFSNPNREEPKFDVNELASIDFRLRIPGIDSIFSISNSIELYGEIGGEDEAGFAPTKSGYIFGVFLPGFIKKSKTDLRVEYANNHVRGSPDVWYNHHIYTSGYTFKGDIIGHHMGSDGDDLFIRVTGYLADWFQVGLEYDIERHGLSNPVIEKKKEAGLDISIHISRRMRYLIGYEYEGIKNLDRDGDQLKHNPLRGEDATNHYGWTSISLIF